MNRRNFLKSAASGLFLAAAPAIVRAESLMVLPPRKKIQMWQGEWHVGDVIHVNDRPHLFLCTIAGNPGTWMEITP